MSDNAKNIKTNTTRRSKRSAIDLLQNRINECFEAKNFYEAEQLYDTLASRLITTKTHQDNGAHVQIFAEGIKRLLDNEQIASGGVVAQLVIHVFESFETPESAEIIEKILQVANLFPDGSKERDEFLSAGVRWSAKFGPNNQGASAFHLELARSLWAKKDFATANSHFLKSDSPIEHAQMLIEWSNSGYRSEVDLFVARAVFQYLSAEDLKGANAVYKSFMDSFETLDTPLTNFCKLLLLTCERDAKPLFMVLKDKYRASIRRDPSFETYVETLGRIYFNIKPQASGLQGMLAGLLGASASESKAS